MCLVHEFLGVSLKGRQNQKRIHNPYLRGPKQGSIATLPLRSRGSPKKGDMFRDGYIDPAFSGAHKRAELLRYPSVLGGPLRKGDKVTDGYTILAFLGVEERAESLQYPYVLAIPKERGEK